MNSICIFDKYGIDGKPQQRYNQSNNFGAGQRFGILQMRRSRQVPQSNGHSEPGRVEARYNGAAGITLGSSDLNGGSLVGKTRRAALKHRGLLELRKGAGFIRQIRWHHGCSSDSS